MIFDVAQNINHPSGHRAQSFKGKCLALEFTQVAEPDGKVSRRSLI